MKRAAIALAAFLGAGGTASAETWTSYVTTPSGLAWSYDADYAWRDARTGKVVVMQAVGKPGAEPRMGPSGPGAADGVGNVVALDCKARTIIMLGAYQPGKPLELDDGWRSAKALRATSAEDRALVEAVCAKAADFPVK